MIQIKTPSALRITTKIERGLGTERARLGRGWLVATRLGRTVATAKIERGLGTERARLGTFRGFGTERARLGTFRGFGTECARLGSFNKSLHFFLIKEQKPGQNLKFSMNN